MHTTELNAGDRIKIGSVVIILESKSGKRARLSIEADQGTPIEVVKCASRREEEAGSNPPVEKSD